MRLPNGKPPRLDWFGHNPFAVRRPKLSRRPYDGNVRDMSDVDTLHREVQRAYRGRRTPRLWLSEFTVSARRDEPRVHLLRQREGAGALDHRGVPDRAPEGLHRGPRLVHAARRARGSRQPHERPAVRRRQAEARLHGLPQRALSRDALEQARASGRRSPGARSARDERLAGGAHRARRLGGERAQRRGQRVRVLRRHRHAGARARRRAPPPRRGPTSSTGGRPPCTRAAWSAARRRTARGRAASRRRRARRANSSGTRSAGTVPSSSTLPIRSAAIRRAQLRRLRAAAGDRHVDHVRARRSAPPRAACRGRARGRACPRRARAAARPAAAAGQAGEALEVDGRRHVHRAPGRRRAAARAAAPCPRSGTVIAAACR